MSTLYVTLPDGGNFAEGRVCWNALNAAARATNTLPTKIDLSGCVHLRPYSIACLVALAARAEARIEVVPPNDVACTRHLERLGFFDWYQGHASSEAIVRDTNVPIRQLTNGPGTFSDEAMMVWAGQVEAPVGVRPRLADSLDEVILNALQHAQSSIGCIVAGQAFPQTGLVEIAVLDLGVTIPKHLGSAPRFNAAGLSDAELILQSTVEAVTGSRSSDNSGVGLFELRQFVESGGGNLTILSGRNYVTFRPGFTPLVKVFHGGFGGTMVNMQFDTKFSLTHRFSDAIL